MFAFNVSGMMILAYQEWEADTVILSLLVGVDEALAELRGKHDINDINISFDMGTIFW